MKNLLLAIGVALCAPFAAFADNIDVKSPDGKLAVTIENTGGKAYYSATLNGKQMIESSQLGVYTDVGDFTTGLTMTGSQASSVSSEYTMTSTKASQAHYKANCVNVDFENGKKQKMTVGQQHCFPLLCPAVWRNKSYDHNRRSHLVPPARTDHHFPLPAEQGHVRLDAHKALL